jgi:hypothetical protein
MVGIPNLEKAPGGLREPWLGYWRASLTQMREAGVWRPAMRPLLDCYVDALRRAEGLYAGGESLQAADRELKRALSYGDALGLTPRGRKALGIARDGELEPEAPTSMVDELAQRKAQKLQGA